jgi:UDP-glucose 4-epimerase
MLQGQPPIIYGTGKRRRDFVYVDDVNDFHLIALVDDRADGNIYNVGSGVNYSVNEIYDLIEGLLGSGLLPIYKSELPGEAEITLADLTAANSLGWTPNVQITQGLSRTIKYLQTQVANAKVAIPGR